MGKPSTKDQIIDILNAHKGTYYSGQELANLIGVSRTAIWKAINSLRDAGFSITGSTKLGYTLSEDTDLLDQNEVLKKLSSEAMEFYQVTCVDSITSTNDALRTAGHEGAPEGTCIIAAQQTKGKGRNGRSFYSPDATGLYLSILLRPDLSFEDAILITTGAAVAAAKACELTNSELHPGDVGIKWVNDLFLEDRKFCGILTEATLNMETARPDFAVLGIGFNLAPPTEGWPEEIKDIAGSLFHNEAPAGSRSTLGASFLNEFLQIYKHLTTREYLEEYRSRSIAIGKQVRILSPGKPDRFAYVTGINDKCELLVRFEGDMKETVLNSGEISLRL